MPALYSIVSEPMNKMNPNMQHHGQHPNSQYHPVNMGQQMQGGQMSGMPMHQRMPQQVSLTILAVNTVFSVLGRNESTANERPTATKASPR